jgi:hypothetical protein
MREECKHFESRTYEDGETMRTCKLDLAPEAPWHCPVDCKAFEPRLADVAWAHGSLISPPTPSEPELDEAAIELLEEAEEIVTEAAPEILHELDEAEQKRTRWWRRRQRDR